MPFPQLKRVRNHRKHKPFDEATNLNQPLPNLLTLADIESKAVLKKLAKAHQALAELKGISASMPNQSILVSTLCLQEAKHS